MTTIKNFIAVLRENPWLAAALAGCCVMMTINVWRGRYWSVGGTMAILVFLAVAHWWIFRKLHQDIDAIFEDDDVEVN